MVIVRDMRSNFMTETNTFQRFNPIQNSNKLCIKKACDGNSFQNINLYMPIMISTP